MTDQEMRNRLLRELESRVVDCENEASEEWGHRSASLKIDPERAERHQRSAALNNRYAEHWRQAIDLLKDAPMPASEEAK